MWCWYFGAGAVEPYVWMGGCAIGGSSVFISLFGYVLSVYHRRDERHAAKPMRPGGLLGLYLCLLMCTCLSSAMLAQCHMKEYWRMM